MAAGKVKTAAAAVWRAVCTLYGVAGEKGEDDEEEEEVEGYNTHITRGASSVPATMNSAARLRLVDFHFY